LRKNFVNVFDETLSTIKNLSENKEIIIVGYVNSNYLDDKCDKPFKELMSLNGFVQTIKSPTHTISHSETLIDVIYSNKPEILMSTNVLLCSLSDHAIYCTRKMNNKKKPSETISFRDYSNYTANSP